MMMILYRESFSVSLCLCGKLIGNLPRYALKASR